MPTRLRRTLVRLLPEPLRSRLKSAWHEERILGRNVWTLLPTRQGQGQRKLLYSSHTRPLANIDAYALSPTAAFSFVETMRFVEEHETVVTVGGGGFLEPRFGWVIHRGQLVPDSVIDPEFCPFPSLRAYARARLFGQPGVRRERTVVSLRDRGEVNYWHFLNDIIGRVRLADQCGIGREVPLVLGQRAMQRAFVKEILETTELGRRNIIIQGGDEFLRANMVVYARTPRNSREQFKYLLKLFGTLGGDARGTERIFLSRAPRSGRAISNMSEIEHVCRRFEFQVITTEGMSVRQQIGLFTRVRYLIAIHGAGLANLVFRAGAPMSLLEIFPPASFFSSYVQPPNYFLVANALGFEYDALHGRPLTENDQGPPYGSDWPTVLHHMSTPFRLDPDDLSRRIQAMI